MRYALASLMSFGLLAANATAAQQKPLKLSLADYEDRVRGSWIGQIIGTLMGFQFEGKVASSPLVFVNQYPKPFEAAQVDDDYYYELVALRAFEKYGIAMTLDQLGQQWKDNSAGSWGSSEQTRLALAKGVRGSEAGHPRYNRLWWTIGPQFSADIYGMIAPGHPNLAGRLARTYGHINGDAEGADGAVFVAGMVSLAFRETDSRKIVREAAKLIHPSSPYRQCLDLVISMAEQGKYQEVFQAVEDRWHIEYPPINNGVANGGTANDSGLAVPYRVVATQPAELFRLGDLTKLWIPDWNLERAGFGGVRGLVLRRTLKLGASPGLEMEVAADQGCAWRLDVFVNNTSPLAG